MAWKRIALKRSSGYSPDPNPAASVGRGGKIRFNKAAQDAYGLVDGTAVNFHEDDDQPGLLGVELLEAGESGQARLRRKDKGENSALVASAALLIKGLAMKPGSYPLGRDDDTGLLTFAYERADEGEQEAPAEEAAEQPARRQGRRRKAA